jgi:hypothetical protein
MKDLYTALEEALSEERSAAEHGIPMDISAFVHEINQAGFVFVSKEAFNTILETAMENSLPQRTQCPPDRDIPDDIPPAYKDDPPY